MNTTICFSNSQPLFFALPVPWTTVTMTEWAVSEGLNYLRPSSHKPSSVRAKARPSQHQGKHSGINNLKTTAADIFISRHKDEFQIGLRRNLCEHESHLASWWFTEKFISDQAILSSHQTLHQQPTLRSTPQVYQQRYSWQHTLNAMRTRRTPNLIQEIDLCDCVGCLPRVLHQQCNEPHKGIQVVVALGSNHSGVGCRIVLLLGQGSIADLNTHFGAKTEKTGDQVICFQDPLLVHLTRKGKNLSTVTTGSSFYNLFQTTHPLQSTHPAFHS